MEGVLDSGAWCSARGSEVERFTEEFTQFQAVPHGVAVTNGSQALEAALAACGVEVGDEVIVPALTFVATATAVLAVNAVPVIVDVDPGSFCIDPAAVEAAMSPRTRAIIAVHLGGTACDMDALLELCRSRDVALIEDCAHSHGTRWRGKGTGAIGDLGGFSFQQSKLLTAGEGGMVTARSEDLIERAWTYANCGRARDGRWYEHVAYGTNLRMTEWQGAVLRQQLRRLPAQHKRREERADLLDAALAALPGIQPQRGDERMDSRARYAYAIRFDPKEFGGLPRAGLEAALEREGIRLSFSYPCLNELEIFRDGNFAPSAAAAAAYKAAHVPQSEAVRDSTIWIDHTVLLADAEGALDVVRALDRIQAHAKAVALRTVKPVLVTEQVARATLRRVRASRA